MFFKKSKESVFLSEADLLGFSPLEVDQLLGRAEEAPRTFKVILDDGMGVQKIDQEKYEALFKVNYLPHLKFESYNEFKRVVQNCPWMLKYFPIGKESRILGIRYRPQIALGTVVDSVICWIDPRIGYGLFAGQDLAEGDFVGEYTGEVRRLSRLHPDNNVYCMHYPTRFLSYNYYMVDSLKWGNETRFINHSDKPNLTPVCLMDRGLLHLVLFANQPIKKGRELTFNYGAHFWHHRIKQ